MTMWRKFKLTNTVTDNIQKLLGNCNHMVFHIDQRFGSVVPQTHGGILTIPNMIFM